MKKMKIFSGFVMIALVLAMGCQDGYIDSITKVDPGPDENAPGVSITYPADSKIVIPFTDEKTTVDFEFTASDDIELASVSIKLNGNELASFDSFKDYRRFTQTVSKADLPIGDHVVTVTATDKSGKSTSTDFAFAISNQYEAKYAGETFYMPFEADLYMDIITNTDVAVEGTPGFGTGKFRRAYAGAEGAYLTYPLEGLRGEEFSATFWYKVNAVPDRAGILTASAPDLANPDAPNNRNFGFRLLRENAGGKQRLKLNIGNGAADVWFDGGANADIDPDAGEWVFIAISVGKESAGLYFNGEPVSEKEYDGVDWTGTDKISIASGAPYFTGWNHFSDASLIDELRFYNKALTQAEIKEVMEKN